MSEGYEELKTAGKGILGDLYNDLTFDAIIQNYYDKHNNTLPDSKWVGRWLEKKFIDALGRPQVIVTSTPYKKGDPQRNKDTAYVYSENAQANAAIHKDSTNPVNFTPRGGLKLNVSDAADTGTHNTAVIRTDSEGRPTDNAFGLVVKLFQQGRDGDFVAQGGLFEDTNEHFALFKELNEQVFGRIAQSGLKKIVFPSSIAMGRARLPKEFAKWLAKELKKRYGIEYDVKESNEKGYSGYGLVSISQKNFQAGPVDSGEDNTRKHWAQFVGDGMGFEVSDSKTATDLGRKFSPFNAILPEGTVYNHKVNGEVVPIDLGGLCIEAAWARLKGHKQAGKKGPQTRHSIIGYDEPVLKNAPLNIANDREHTQYNIYKWLWEKFFEGNPELKQQLLEATENGKKTLTDRYASFENRRHKINQARAIAEILFGKADSNVSSAIREQREKQWENAQRGVRDIMSDIRRTTSGVKVVQYEKKDESDYQKGLKIAREAKHKDDNGNDIRKNNLPQKDDILTFKLPGGTAHLTQDDKNFQNPFEGQENALEKYILWLLPEDFLALPKELRVEEQRRTYLRIAWSKGYYKDRVFYTNDTGTEGLRYVDVLRYMVDNFRQLRSLYNPVSDNFATWARGKQNVIIAGDVGDDSTPASYTAYTTEEVRDSPKPSKSVTVFYKSDSEYVLKVNVPKNGRFTKDAMERIAKSIATSVPRGVSLTVEGTVSDIDLAFLEKVADYGFYLAKRTSGITKEDGVSMDAPVYVRETLGKETVRKYENTPDPQDAFNRQDTHVYLFGGNVRDMQALAGDSKAVGTAKYRGKEGHMDYLRGVPNAIEIPVKNTSGWTDSDHFTDKDFDVFKKALDKALELARKAASDGKVVMIPKNGVAREVSNVMEKNAPRIWEYLKKQMDAFEEELNYLYNAELERNTPTVTVEMPEDAPFGSEDVVDVRESAYTRVQNEFSGRGQLMDAIDFVTTQFLGMISTDKIMLKRKTQNEFKQLSDSDPTQRSDYYKLQEMLMTLDDDLKATQLVVGRLGSSEDIFNRLSKIILAVASRQKDPAVAELMRKAADRNNVAVLLQYATPYIEQRCGARILVTKGVVSVKEVKTEEQRMDNEDDPESKRSSGANDWSFNVRLADPYKSLSQSVRRMISTIRMRDLNDPRRFVKNSFGMDRYYDPKFIYTCLMSFMAQHYRRSSDFVVFDEAPDVDPEGKGMDKKHFPLGIPRFPILEEMAKTYVWVDDLINEFTDSYKYVENTDRAIEAGNVVSQFITNFNQQFISYFVLKDGHLYAENQPTGEESLRQSVTSNYEGGVRLVGSSGQYLDMVYNLDLTVNQDNVNKAYDEVSSLKNMLQRKGDEDFWSEFNDFLKDVEDAGWSRLKLYDTISKASDDGEVINRTRYRNLKLYNEMCVRTSDVMKSMGIDMSPFDVMCILFSRERNISGGVLLTRLQGILAGLKRLDEEDHLINSTKHYDATESGTHNYTSVESLWNQFFEEFGEWVTDRELQASFHSKDGNTRYSYSAPSYLSSMLIYLSDPDDNLRRQYIEENFKYDPTFWDNKKQRYRNWILQMAFDTPIEVDTHDLIGMYRGDTFKEYADWNKAMLEEIGLREYWHGSKSGNNSLFVIPILSDHECMKVVGLPIKTDSDTTTNMFVEVVHQELDRMELVKKRVHIIELQDKYRENPDSLTDREKDELRKQPYIHDVNNFDRRGLKFQFTPELDTATMHEREGGVLGIAASIANSLKGNNADRTSYTLIDMLGVLKEADPEDLVNALMSSGAMNLGLGTNAEEFSDTVIAAMVDKVMREKFRKWAYYKYDGKEASLRLRSDLVDTFVKATPDNSFSERRSKLPSGTDLTPEQKLETYRFYKDVERELYTFYINHAYATSQMIQVLSTDVAYYDGAVDFSKRWYSVYSSGQRLNTSSKFGKTHENYLIIKDNKRVSRSIELLKDVLDRAVDEGRLDKIDREIILGKFKSINGTDAQAFRSLTSYRSLMDMAGKWTVQLERSYNNLKNHTWTMNDFYTVFQTIKPFVFSNEPVDSGFGTQMRVPTIHKNSEAILLAIYDTIVGSDVHDSNYSTRLVGINRAMEEIKLRDADGNIVKDRTGKDMLAIDLVQYESAVKIGGQGVVDLRYSPYKLGTAWKNSKIEYGGKSFSVSDGESYDSIVKRLEKDFNSNKITGDEYNGFLDALDFTTEDYYKDENGKVLGNGSQEVRDILEKAITERPNDISGTEATPTRKDFFNRQVLHSVAYSSYMFQVATPNHYTDNNKATFGSQLRHLVMADLPDIDPSTGKTWKITLSDGKSYDRDELRKLYNSLIVANLVEAYDNLSNLLHDDDDRPTIYKLADRIREIVGDSDKYGREIIQAIDIVEDPDTGKPTFALPLNNINVTVKLEEILLSLFKNAIAKQTINGGNVILAADVEYVDSLQVVGERDENGKLTKVEGVECFLPAHMRSTFEYLLEKDDKGDVKRDENGNITAKLDINTLKKMGLDKLIGYRIPTEGLYSALPLIIKGFLPQQSGSSIVVAKEVTTFTGSDNDVDKMFLFIKALDEKTMRPVEYDWNKDVLSNSKAARDNLIIDIMQAVITNPTMSDKWVHPGNFDNIDLNAKRLRILKDSDLLSKYASVNNISTDDAVARLTGPVGDITKRIKELTTFIKDNEPPLSPIYFDTFLKFHAQNMAGVAEKGIFANNNLTHAKLQWVDINIAERFRFNFNGRRIAKLDDRYIELPSGRKSIQENCAECGAAAVDNAKNPCLFDLNCNVHTAPVFGFMLRLGLTIEEASLLLAQPDVDILVHTGDGRLRSDMLVGKGNKVVKKIQGYLKTFHGVDVNIDPDCDWHSHNFKTADLYKTIVKGKDLLETYRKKGPDSRGTDEEKEMLITLYNAYNLLADILDMQQDFMGVSRTLYYDSPTHAIARSMAGVVLQTKTVQDLNERKYQSEDSKFFTGLDDLMLYYIDRGGSSKSKSTGEKLLEEQAEFLFGESGKSKRRRRKKKMFDLLMDTKLPITQSFYTLGIEKAREEYKDRFLFGREEVQDITDRLCKVMDDRRIFKHEDREKVLAQAYMDFIVFMLTKNDLFGDDSNFSFDEKRQFYLYKYPRKFLNIVGKYPQLQNNECIRRLTVQYGQIKLLRQGQLSTTMRDILMDSFDKLINSKNPDKKLRKIEMDIAKDLFMYCYYLNGFEFSYMSFGNLMGTQFLCKFPKYIQALRRMQKAPITDVDTDRFFEQFLLKRNYLGLLVKLSYGGDRNASTPEFVNLNGYYSSELPLDYFGDDIPKFVKVEKDVMYYSKEDSLKRGTLCFIPIRMATSLHYNAMQDTDELVSVVYDMQEIKKNREVGSPRLTVEQYNKQTLDKDKTEPLSARSFQDQSSYTNDSSEKDGPEGFEVPPDDLYGNLVDDEESTPDGSVIKDTDDSLGGYNDSEISDEDTGSPVDPTIINDEDEWEGYYDQGPYIADPVPSEDTVVDVEGFDGDFAMTKVTDSVANEIENLKKEAENNILDKRIC